ncbi:Rieske (2Fe-2S) protein [Natronorubrum sp. FCH18a]|uniref:Rieske (2Fe-2S) protein n=1 Tax=Natronorubrum sp. FCH18a TaxID=3447018 RepID=UPI003F50E0B6
MKENEHIVGKHDEIKDNERILVELEGREIAVFKIDGKYHAYTNWCPHQGGPLCEGELSGTTETTYDKKEMSYEVEWVKENQVVVCPWHGWEFDVVSGESCHQPVKTIPTHPVQVKDGNIIVTL